MSKQANMEGLPQSFFDAIQYFAHSGDVACLLAPQRMLLGVHNINGDTALHTAVLADNTSAALAFVRVMIAEDLDVLNADGQTALHLALMRGNVAVAHALCTRGARSDLQDAQGNTPLHLATNAALTRAVLTAGPQPLTILNANGLNPLHVAASSGRVDVVLELVARQGMDVNSADRASGRTALHHAVRARSRAICELLLEYDADCNAEDHSGYTPLHTAVQYDLYDIAKLLIDFGADALAQNAYFQSPHDLALHYGSTEAYRAIESFPSIRTPTRNLLSVATNLFGLAAVTGPQQHATQQQQTQHTVPSVTAVSSAPVAAKTLTAPTARTSAQPAADRKSSFTDGGDEWQVVDNEELAADADVEWHLHRNKKLPGSGIAKDIQKIFNSKRSKLSKDKDLSTTSSANIARRSAPTPGSAAPLSAKAEKARLAQQYGVPEIAVTQPSTMTASEEKRSLERKYAPKIELDVVDQKRKATAGDSMPAAATLKAAEAAAQHATPRQLSKFDELSTLD